ncbi:MAG: aspartate kinase [Lentimicrobiaceae bacterium]
MKVFKFGGASVKDAEAVKNVFHILAKYAGEELCIVFSAMGKTTNALEKVVDAWMNQDPEVNNRLKVVEDYHLAIANELSIGNEPVEYWIHKLKEILELPPPALYDVGYDAVVSYGELLSTAVISAFLKNNDYKHTLLDAREMIITGPVHRNAPPDWEETQKRIEFAFNGIHSRKHGLVAITQGFIGSTFKGESVTLGREGSDFSAAIFAWALNADEMIIWKDVPGVLNADPRFFEHTVKLDKMSYRDAIELAYYGASVIHPKTIQPLQNRQIPLYVKSFYQPDEPGTLIHTFEADSTHQLPCFIFKPDQVLISISPRDFSFIAEDNLHNIFGLIASLGIHLNMMQHSAITFSIVMDNHPDKVQRLFKALGSDFRVRYNSGLELITIRYYDQATIDQVTNKRKILLEQKSRTTVQLVVSE